MPRPPGCLAGLGAGVFAAPVPGLLSTPDFAAMAGEFLRVAAVIGTHRGRGQGTGDRGRGARGRGQAGANERGGFKRDEPPVSGAGLSPL